MLSRGFAIILMLLPLTLHGQAGAKKTTNHTTPHMSPNEQAIRAVYDAWAKAFRAKDLDGIMAVYAPGNALIAYDVVAPLQYRGKEAYRKDYTEFLAMYQGPIEIEYRDLRIIADGNVALIHALERISGTLKNGSKSEVWMRATSGLRKINGKWL